AEELAHGAAGIGRQELQGRGLGGGCGHHDRVIERPVTPQRTPELRPRRALLPDRNIDAIELPRLVASLVDIALVDEGVDRDGSLAGLAVADDELTLAAADRHERVERLEAGLYGLVHGAARNDTGCLHLDTGALDVGKRAAPVDGITEGVDHAPEEAFAHGHGDDGAGALHGVALAHARVVAEDHHADIVALEVERHTLGAVRELDHLAGLDLVEAVNARDAVAHRKHLTHLGDIRLGAEIGDLLLQDG